MTMTDDKRHGAPAASDAENGPPRWHYELTPIGEQAVIPGCERRDTSTTQAQGDLWGATEEEPGQ